MPNGTVAGRVYADLNGNYQPDPGEPGIGGVTVEMLDSDWQPVVSGQTDADGNYSLADVPDDLCTSRFTLPAGSPYSFGSARSG